MPTDAVRVGLALSDLAPGGGGKLLASTNTYRSNGYFAVARMTATGALDKAFGVDGYTKPLKLSRANDDRLRGWAVARQGSRIILAGYRENEFGGTAPMLARFSADGGLDHRFGSDGVVAPRPASEGQDPGDAYYRLKGGGRILDIAVRADGEIIAVGGIDEESGPKPAAMVAAYRPDGTLDKSFGRNGRVLFPEPRQGTYTGFSKVELLPGGRVLTAGYLHGRLALVGLDSGGRLDSAFGGDGVVTPGAAKASVCCSTVAALATAKNGRILLGGVADGRKQSPFVLVRMKRDGSPDLSFGRGGVSPSSPERKSTRAFDPYSMTVEPNGHIVVAGIAEHVGPGGRISSVPALLAYRESGLVDRSFGRGGAEFPVESGAGGLAIAAMTAAGRTYIAGGSYELAPGRPKYRPLLVQLGASRAE